MNRHGRVCFGFLANLFIFLHQCLTALPPTTITYNVGYAELRLNLCDFMSESVAPIIWVSFHCTDSHNGIVAALICGVVAIK